MRSAFQNLDKNKFSRKFGGTQYGTADPYLTGYHFVWFDKLPPTLKKYTVNRGSQLGADADIQSVLAATCTGVTPPGGTLNKVEFTGLGGIKWAVPGNIDYGNSISVKFTEFDTLPIFDIFHSWFKMIRDYRTGAVEHADLEDGEDGSGYTKETYAATMYYWTTSPDGKTIQFSGCYDGMFPNKDPQDLFSSDVETVGKLDIEIEFNVDTAWNEPWVKEKCEGFLSHFNNSRTEILSQYGQSGSATG